MKQQFLNQSEIHEVATEVLAHFQFNLTSRSSINEVTEVALEKLQDNGLPTRRSLAIIIAKKAKARFIGEIQEINTLIRNQRR